jgi:hypothetical protein
MLGYTWCSRGCYFWISSNKQSWNKQNGKETNEKFQQFIWYFWISPNKLLKLYIGVHLFFSVLFISWLSDFDKQFPLIQGQLQHEVVTTNYGGRRWNPSVTTEADPVRRIWTSWYLQKTTIGPWVQTYRKRPLECCGKCGGEPTGVAFDTWEQLGGGGFCRQTLWPGGAFLIRKIMPQLCRRMKRDNRLSTLQNPSYSYRKRCYNQLAWCPSSPYQISICHR